MGEGWRWGCPGVCWTEDVRAAIIGPEMNARAAVSQVEVLLAGYVSAARDEPVELPLSDFRR